MNRWLANGALALVAAPFALVLVRAFGADSLEPLARLAQTALPDYVANTLLLALLTLALALPLGAGAAWLVCFHRFPGRDLFDGALVLPLAVPAYLLAISYRELSHLQHWPVSVETLWGAGALMALALYPYVYLLARATFRRQAASQLEAARALGVGGHALVWRVLLPLCLPALALGAMIVVIEVVSDFGTVDILGVPTLTVAVRRLWFAAFDPATAIRLALLTAVVPLLLVAAYALLTGRRAFHSPPNRPRPPQPAALAGWRRWLAPLACTAPVLLGFVVPVWALAGWAAERFDRIDLTGLLGEIANSILLALTAAAIGLALGFWLAVTGRMAADRRWSLAALGLVGLNFAMPAMVLAFAALVLTGWGAAGWLADTVALVMLAVALRYTVFAHAAAETGLSWLPRQLDETVSSLGRGRAVAVFRVLLPLTRASLAVGGLLIVVNALKELTLSLTLQPFGYSSLAMSAYHYAKVDAYQQGAVYALCLIMVALYPVLSLHRWFDGR